MNPNKFYEGYEKLKTVGKGSFGTATLYRRLIDNKYVVMKEIYTMDMDKAEKLSALNEIEILATLNHSNIIRYLGNFEKDALLVIIMEYANGGNLAQLIRMKKTRNELFTEPGILNILQQICLGLSYMHKKKILHRDLKTANIFLNLNGSIKIGDFGISKMLNTRSQAQTVVGTPYYLSPEMCEGSDYNEKSDIWAVGCILYELATFRKPFDAPTLPVLVQKIIACEYDEISGTYSKDLFELIKSILQKNCAERPSAQVICETAIPKILQKNNLTDDFNNLSDLNSVCSNSNERSILYEISNFGPDQNVVPIDLPHKVIIDFSISSTHYLVVTSDNLVYGWGKNTKGQLGLGPKNGDFRKNPTYINYLRGKNIIKCSAGEDFSIFLNDQGILMSCGNGCNGSLGHSNWNRFSHPTIINYFLDHKIKIEQIACGQSHVAAISSDGKLFTWGSCSYGELGQGLKRLKCNKPKEINVITMSKIFRVYCTKNTTILLTTNGQVFGSGNNEYQKLGIISKDKEIYVLMPINQLNNEKIKDVGIGENHTAFLNSNGKIFLFGQNEKAQLGKANNFLFKYNTNSFNINYNSNVKMLTCGDNFTVAADDRQVLWLWGTFDKTTVNKNSNNNQTKKHSYAVLDIKNESETIVTKVERLSSPQSILAFYSSQQNIKSSNIIYVEKTKALKNSLFVLANTTSPPPIKQLTNSDLVNSNFMLFQDETNNIPSTITDLPNTPKPM